MEKPNETAELVGQIIDFFEDFLGKRGIKDLGNSEIADAIRKDGAKPDELAIIYGSDYGEIQTFLEDTFKNWNISPDSLGRDINEKFTPDEFTGSLGSLLDKRKLSLEDYQFFENLYKTAVNHL